MENTTKKTLANFQAILYHEKEMTEIDKEKIIAYNKILYYQKTYEADLAKQVN